MKEKNDRRPIISSALRDVRNLGDVVVSCRNNSMLHSLNLLATPWNVYVIYFLVIPGILGLLVALGVSSLFGIPPSTTLDITWLAVSILTAVSAGVWFNHVPKTPVLVLFEKGILYKKTVLKTSEIAEIYMGVRENRAIKKARTIIGALSSNQGKLMSMTENAKAAAVCMVRTSGSVLVMDQASVKINRDDLDAVLRELKARAPEIKFESP